MIQYPLSAKCESRCRSVIARRAAPKQSPSYGRTTSSAASLKEIASPLRATQQAASRFYDSRYQAVYCTQWEQWLWVC
jgi:Tfp pilus assembly protein FimV